MTHRQRALAALRGQRPDRVPFIGRMELWYNHAKATGRLPQRYRQASLWDLQRDLDIGIYAHVPMGLSFFRLEHHRVDLTQTTDGDEQTTIYHTPHGDLRTRFRLTRELTYEDIQPLQVEWPFKSEADYDALAFVLDDLTVVENFAAYAEVRDAVGEDGLTMPQTGYVPIHRLAHTWFGYERFFLELYDHQDRVEALHEILRDKHLQVLRLAADAPCDAIAIGGNYDEALTPPPFYDHYVKPFYSAAREILKDSGKPVTTHGDGEMRKLLGCLVESELDGVEAVTPQPMTSIDLRYTRELWSDKLTLWGGIASVVLTPTFSHEAFEAHLDELFAAVAPGDRFILGFGDNVPTDGLFERVEQIARYVREYGDLPLTGTASARAR